MASRHSSSRPADRLRRLEDARLDDVRGGAEATPAASTTEAPMAAASTNPLYESAGSGLNPLFDS